MKLLFAIKAMNNAHGGAERVLADITAGLVGRGHEVILLSYDPPGGESFYQLDMKVKRICLGIGKTDQRTTFRETWTRMRALRKTVQAETPDIVIAFMHSMFVPMTFALIGTGIPVLASEHIVPAHYRTRRFEFLLLLLSALCVRKITVLSDTVKNLYPAILRGKMIAIPNPVHTPTGFANPLGSDAVRKIILNVGRLDQQKEQKLLIEAFALLAPNYPEWDVKIIGEGELRERLEELIKQLGMEKRVLLPGATKSIEHQYQQAHIFALPSRYESFGLATAEAMAHGLPVVGFADCPGTNELIENGENGILVNGENRVQAFSSGLQKLINSPDLRVKLGHKAKLNTEMFHSLTIVDKWEKLLKAVLAQT